MQVTDVACAFTGITLLVCLTAVLLSPVVDIQAGESLYRNLLLLAVVLVLLGGATALARRRTSR